jgi:hypothetical protein
LLDDPKWCFDTPASTVLELGLMRLGVPVFFANLMADLGVHMVRSAVTASGTTVGLAGLFHRQLHGTGQGAVKGPINWIPIADIAICHCGWQAAQSGGVHLAEKNPTPHGATEFSHGFFAPGPTDATRRKPARGPKPTEPATANYPPD